MFKKALTMNGHGKRKTALAARMRTPAFGALALRSALAGLLAIGAAGAAEAAIGADTIAPLSLRWTATGQSALDRHQTEAAIDAFETALAVDPKNGHAFVGLAHAYVAEGLPGRAIKYYREALALDPNDLGALEDQGKALVSRGAVERAKANLARIKTLCAGECAPAKRLEVAIATPLPVAKTAAVDVPKPVSAKN